MTTRPPKLVRLLLVEAFQTEESAMKHPAREARRLGGAPPAAAMLAVSAHARTSLETLERLAVARGQSAGRAGTFLGQLFSVVRGVTTDLVLSAEKSYRGTILGMHHGIGVFHLLEDAAIVAGDEGLADFCAAWLGARVELVAAAERELEWFARNPEIALGRASRGIPRLTRPTHASAS